MSTEEQHKEVIHFPVPSGTEHRLHALETRFAALEARLHAVETEAQARGDAPVETRLAALEQASHSSHTIDNNALAQIADFVKADLVHVLSGGALNTASPEPLVP